MGPFFMPQHHLIAPLSAEKIGLSAEILGPKVGLIFHQNVVFNSF